MKFSCVLILLFINCVRTNLESYDGLEVLRRNLVERYISTYENPSFRNKRDSPPSNIGISEGGNQPLKPDNAGEKPKILIVPDTANKTVDNTAINDKPAKAHETEKGDSGPAKETATIAPNLKPAVPNVTPTKEKTPESRLDFGDPGVIERGLIVFGGFAMLGLAYFIFYRKSSVKHDAMNPTDNNQFRYGVLNSEDQRESMELSRVPLTMDSEDDDEEDLEIFDLTQKKKSLPYVNLQSSEHKSDMETITDNNAETLLLDIDDRTDTLINWSNENKT